jgi:hypothetical protein
MRRLRQQISLQLRLGAAGRGEQQPRHAEGRCPLTIERHAKLTSRTGAAASARRRLSSRPSRPRRAGASCRPRCGTGRTAAGRRETECTRELTLGLMEDSCGALTRDNAALRSASSSQRIAPLSQRTQVPACACRLSPIRAATPAHRHSAPAIISLPPHPLAPRPSVPVPSDDGAVRHVA